MYFNFFFITFILVFFNACSSNKDFIITSNNELKNLPFPSASLENTLINVNHKLINFYNEWEGVDYKWGGNSKKGVDCSAFIQKAYKKSFNLNIPRTTIKQVKIGRTINKSHLKIGDLVFFKTGFNTRHVGIYLENGKFMHASTKKGVTISKLNNNYYKKHYWTAKRLIF